LAQDNQDLINTDNQDQHQGQRRRTRVSALHGFETNDHCPAS